jgi:DNA primase large subunit
MLMAQTETRDTVQSEDLRDSEMMRHLLDALESGKDIGHYGRLVFVMVARHFMDEDEMAKLLAKEPDTSEEDARELIAQVKGHDYNPPKRN